MNRGHLAVVLIVVIAPNFGSPARAAVSITLVPDAPYFEAAGDSRINIDVFLENDGEGVMAVRLLQFDFALTDTQLGVGEFEFDFSALDAETLYEDFSVGTLVNRVYVAPIPAPGFILELDEGSHLIGRFEVTGPGAPGNYVIDLLNAQAADFNAGALVQWGFDETKTAWSGDGSLTGGRAVVYDGIPEPATLLLVALGGVAAVRRRVASVPRSA